MSHINLAQRVAMPLVEAETMKTWEIPSIGILKIECMYTPSIPTKSCAISDEGLDSFIHQLRNCATSFDMIKLLRIAAKDVYLFTPQAQLVVNKLQTHLGIFDIMACLLSRS